MMCPMLPAAHTHRNPNRLLLNHRWWTCRSTGCLMQKRAAHDSGGVLPPRKEISYRKSCALHVRPPVPIRLDANANPRVLAECRAVLQQTQAMIAEKVQVRLWWGAVRRGRRAVSAARLVLWPLPQQHAVACFHDADCLLHALQRKQREDEARKNKGQAERERIRLAIEEDRKTRAVMNEVKQHHGPAVSEWDPSSSLDRQRQAGGAPGPGGAVRRGQGAEEELEAEEEEEEEQ